MTITHEHLQFWRAKKFPLPAWAETLRAQVPSIDRIIEINAGERFRYLEASNTLSLIRMMARRQPLRDVLWKLAVSPYSSKRRVGLCAKWAMRIERGGAA